MVATHLFFFYTLPGCISLRRRIIFAVRNRVAFKCLIRAAFYQPNIPTVNNLSVCHPCRHRPILSAQTGAFAGKRRQILHKTIAMTICAALCLIKVSPNLRPPSFEDSVLERRQTARLRRWLQLWPLHRCFAGEKWSCFLKYHNARQNNRLLTHGCTVRRCDLQAEQKSQVEQPHRHLLSNALWCSQ